MCDIYDIFIKENNVQDILNRQVEHEKIQCFKCKLKTEHFFNNYFVIKFTKL